MTRSANFTQAQVGRAIAAAKKAGLRVLGIRADGTVIVYDGDGPIAEALQAALGVSPERNSWDDVLDRELEEWTASNEPSPPAATKAALEEAKKWADPEWREKRLEKWKAHVRQSPLGKLERKGLAGLYAQKGRPPQRIKGASINTMDKLEVRGFAAPVGKTKSGLTPFYEITAEGEAHWLSICDGDSRQ